MQTLVLWYVMLCSLVFEAVCFLKSCCVQTTRHHTSEASVQLVFTQIGLW